MTTPELIAWLRENSSGVYRPTAEAADLLERYDAALREIEVFGHGKGHGCGYTCADIANRALPANAERLRSPLGGDKQDALVGNSGGG